MKTILILGSKEYPLGTNQNYDPHPSGGMEVYTQKLAQILAKNNKIKIITRKFPNTSKKELIDSVEIYRVPFIKGRLIRNASFNIFSMLKAIFVNYDVLITQDLIASLLGVFVSKVKRKPQISVCHGLVSNQPQFSKQFRLFIKIMEKFAFNLSTVTVTHAPERYIKQITKKYRIIKPGFDFPKKENKIKNNYKGKIIIYTGRLLRVKHVEDLLKSLKYLNFEYTCLIIGDGEQKKELEKLAKLLEVNAVFIGNVDDVSPYLNIADVFVLPSSSESLNYSMLEAMQYEIPCVITDIGIASEEEAFIVKCGKPESIANGIENALNTEKSRKKVGNAKKFLKQFRWKKTAESYEELINELTAK